MGLLSKLAGIAPAKAPSDEVLLLHSMFLMASADGEIDCDEGSMLEAFINTLPEFREQEFDELMSQCNRLVAKFPSLKESVAALKGIESPVIKKKAYFLAVDIAMSSGDVDEAEDELLEAMQRILGIDDAFAQRAIEMVQVKYAT